MPGGEPTTGRTTVDAGERALRAARRAERLVGMGRSVEAVATLRRAMAAGADRYECALEIARICRELGLWTQALNAAEEAVSADPTRLPAREIVIALRLRGRDFEGAIEAGRALLKIDPRHLNARDVLGAAYVGLGNVEAAMEMAREMVRLDPGEPGHHFKLGLLNEDRGNIRAAVDEFERVLQMDPDDELAESTREQLDTLDLHQVHMIMVLAEDDPAFWGRLTRDPMAAARSRGFRLSSIGWRRLARAVQYSLQAEEPEDGPTIH